MWKSRSPTPCVKIFARCSLFVGTYALLSGDRSFFQADLLVRRHLDFMILVFFVSILMYEIEADGNCMDMRCLLFHCLPTHSCLSPHKLLQYRHFNPQLQWNWEPCKTAIVCVKGNGLLVTFMRKRSLKRAAPPSTIASPCLAFNNVYFFNLSFEDRNFLPSAPPVLIQPGPSHPPTSLLCNTLKLPGERDMVNLERKSVQHNRWSG